jgi:hypothetical protein
MTFLIINGSSNPGFLARRAERLAEPLKLLRNVKLKKPRYYKVEQKKKAMTKDKRLETILFYQMGAHQIISAGLL